MQSFVGEQRRRRRQRAEHAPSQSEGKQLRTQCAGVRKAPAAVAAAVVAVGAAAAAAAVAAAAVVAAAAAVAASESLPHDSEMSAQ